MAAGAAPLQAPCTALRRVTRGFVPIHPAGGGCRPSPPTIGPVLRVVVISALLTGLIPAPARGAPWHRPVDGRIVGTFSFSPAAPYVPGQRRGIAIATDPGIPVRAVCGGPVVFAGHVGRAGPTLSVQCGRLRATYQGIQDITVAEGAVVVPGAVVARAGPSGVLRVGARVAANRYVDPAALMADERPPLGPAPRPGRRTDRRPPPPIPRPAPVPMPALAPAPAASAVPILSPAVWLALTPALVLVALPGVRRLRHVCRLNRPDRRPRLGRHRRARHTSRPRRARPRPSPAA